jgi:hypothetical protein
MNDLPRRSWVFLMTASPLAILTARGIGPAGIVIALILLLGLGLRVEWFVPMLLAFWALLTVPFLAALGASEMARDRMAVLFLALMAAGLARLIAEVRKQSKRTDFGSQANPRSPNGKVGPE